VLGVVVGRNAVGRTRTMRRGLVHLAVLTMLAPLLLASSPAEDDPCAGVLCAGAASVDATWNTGSGQGQLGGAGNHISEDTFDPYGHTTKMTPTEGIHSRTYAKSVVLQGPDGTRAAYVKTEVYLQQDLLWQRVAELVTGGNPLHADYAVEGLDPDGIMLGGTHNHSAPHYTSTAWGVWIFADVLDFRAFDHTAKRIARSIREAADRLEPAEVGAAVVRQGDVQQNILGPATADDGSPAGFPRDHVDDELAVIRIDAAATGAPIGAIVNFGMHPESLGGAGLISADFTGIVERDVERALGRAPGADEGPVVAWSQGGLGDVEPDASRANAPEEGREYWRRNFSQMERMSRDLTDSVTAAWTYAADPEAGADDPAFVADKHVPMSADAPVDVVAYRVPGPPAHPTPTVSNCRTDTPGIPVAGFPDCMREGELPDAYGDVVDGLGDAGVPVPENYGAPAYGAVNEALTMHLQTFRIGEVLLAACPCEPVADMALNFKSRADAESDNLHLGHLPTCEETDDPDVYSCAFERHAWQEPEWRDVDREAVERMRAQITHDAAGWQDDPAHLGGEAEPSDPELIKGNFTHDELDEDGFTLPLMVGTANDHIGYVVTYREFQRGDHYRKALTPFGPRTADMINTRLLEMARELRGGDAPTDVYELAVGTLDQAIQTGKVAVFGAGSDLGSQAYEAALPDDGGTPGEVREQPTDDVERFSAATFTWEGGSNYTDNPDVEVQRLVTPDEDGDDDGPRRPGRPDGVGGPPDHAGGPPSGVPGRVPGGPSGDDDGDDGDGDGGDDTTPAEPEWRTVATQEGGEVVLSMDFASHSDGAALGWLAGDQAYPWTATFEVFDGVADGTYRFVVRGRHRDGGEAHPYALASEPFEVGPWRGIDVAGLTVDGDTASFAVAGVEVEVDEEQIPGPVEIDDRAVRYPFTYEAPVAFIGHDVSTRTASDGTPVHRDCLTCSFRPWATHGEVVEAAVTVHRDGDATTHAASFDAASGRWVATGLGLTGGETVTVEPGQVVDEHGNVNGERATS
jgi:hypothetical protein